MQQATSFVAIGIEQHNQQLESSAINSKTAQTEGDRLAERGQSEGGCTAARRQHRETLHPGLTVQHRAHKLLGVLVHLRLAGAAVKHAVVLEQLLLPPHVDCQLHACHTHSSAQGARQRSTMHKCHCCLHLEACQRFAAHMALRSSHIPRHRRWRWCRVANRRRSCRRGALGRTLGCCPWGPAPHCAAPHSGPPPPHTSLPTPPAAAPAERWVHLMEAVLSNPCSFTCKMATAAAKTHRHIITGHQVCWSWRISRPATAAGGSDSRRWRRVHGLAPLQPVPHLRRGAPAPIAPEHPPPLLAGGRPRLLASGRALRGNEGSTSDRRSHWQH